MNITNILPYLTGPTLAAGAIGLSRMSRGLTRKLYEHALTTADKGDDIITARWMARAEWFALATDFLVHWFVPAAFAPQPREGE